MSPARKLIRLALVYLAAAILLFFGGRLAATVPESAPLLIPQIPRAINAWQGTDQSREAAGRFFRVAGGAVFEPLVRVFRKPAGKRLVVLNALEDLKGFQRGIHDPRFCYEALGWTIDRVADIRINVNGKEMPARLLTYTGSRRPGKRMEIYTYFYDGQTVTSDLALRMRHFRNRLLQLVRRPSGHLLYLGLSVEQEGGREKDLAGELGHLMGAILGGLVAGKGSGSP